MKTEVKTEMVQTLTITYDESEKDRAVKLCMQSGFNIAHLLSTSLIATKVIATEEIITALKIENVIPGCKQLDLFEDNKNDK